MVILNIHQYEKISHFSTISSVIALVFIVPQIASAAWWNPLDWFNGWSFFHRTDTQTQVLENRVKELEKRLETTSTSTAVVATTTEQSQTTKRPVQITPVVNVGAKNTTPVIDVPVVKQPAPAQPAQPVKDYEKLYAELQAKYRDMRDITVHNAIVPLEELTSRTTIQSGYLSYLRALETQLNTDMNAIVKLNNVKPKQADIIEYYISRFAGISTEFSGQKIRYQTNLAEENAAAIVTKQNAEQQAIQNAIQAKIEINTKIAEMNQLNVQIDTYQTNYTLQEFLNILNSARKLDGQPVFASVTSGNQITPYPYKTSGIPTPTTLHAFVANYRATLYVELQKYP